MKLFGINIGAGNSLKDKLYWLINGFMTNMGFMLWGGGGGGSPAPTTSTSYTTNIPEYAQPYVENMLNAAQAQIYNPSMTGFNAYTPYSTNPSNYVAAASPMQQQAYSTAANMRVPSQYGMATRGTLGAMQGLGGVGQQMGQAGNQYMNMATNPYATQAFMNPYLQASLAPQLALANQQYGIAGQQEQSNAAQQGAFGGTREALMASQNAQNQMLAQNQLIGQGYTNAFNQAQQAQQFGANLGLQGEQGQMAGLQGYLGGANQLAGIGNQQLAAQQGIANQQNTFGQQQQTQQQNIINQAVQNYATAQQYPFMQLGLLNSMLRGLPMQQSSTQMYQAPPNPLGTALGLGALAMGQSTKQKEGGVVKAAAGIPMSMYTKDQLNSPYLSPVKKLVSPLVQQEQQRIESNPEAKQVFAQPLQMPSPQQMAQAPQNRSGLDAIGTGNMVPTVQAAGGGLLAFVGGGDTSTDGTLVPPPDYDQKAADVADQLSADKTSAEVAKAAPAKTPVAKAPTNKTASAQSNFDKLSEVLLNRINATTPDQVKETATEKKQREALESGIANREKNKESDFYTQLGANLLSQTGPFLATNFGNATKDTLNYMATQENLTDKDRQELLKLAIEKDKSNEAAYDRMLTAGISAEGVKASKEATLANVYGQNQIQNQLNQAKLLEKANTDFATKVQQEEQTLRSDKALMVKVLSGEITPNQLTNMARVNVMSRMDPAYLQQYNLAPATPAAPVAQKAPGAVDLNNPLLKG